MPNMQVNCDKFLIVSRIRPEMMMNMKGASRCNIESEIIVTM